MSAKGTGETTFDCIGDNAAFNFGSALAINCETSEESLSAIPFLSGKSCDQGHEAGALAVCCVVGLAEAGPEQAAERRLPASMRQCRLAATGHVGRPHDVQTGLERDIAFEGLRILEQGQTAYPQAWFLAPVRSGGRL